MDRKAVWNCTGGRRIMDKLKPCPYCGYDAFIETMKVRKGYEAVIHCNGCLANIPTITFNTKNEAVKEVIEAWNKRTEE